MSRQFGSGLPISLAGTRGLTSHLICPSLPAHRGQPCISAGGLCLPAAPPPLPFTDFHPVSLSDFGLHLGICFPKVWSWRCSDVLTS